MTTKSSTKLPTQAEVEMYVAQAHQMRAEYFARFLKAGFANVRDFFKRNQPSANSPS